MKNLTVLYVTNQSPWPAISGGQRREFEILRRLARRHRIHLATVGTLSGKETEGSEEERELRPILADVASFRVARRDSQGLDIQSRIADHYDLLAETFMLSQLRRVRPDIVHVEGFFLMYTLPDEVWMPPIILAEENIEFSIVEPKFDARDDSLTHGPLYQAEVAAWCRADSLVAVSEQDARVMASICGAPVSTVPNSGSHIVPPQALNTQERRNTAGYLGNYTWSPSRVIGATLLQKVWPAIRSRVKQAELHVMGVGWPASLACLEEGVLIVGQVPNVAEALAHLSVFLCPADSTTGSKLKMHEALHVGCPIVTLPGGLGGFPDRAQAGVAMAENLGEFVDHTIRILGSDNLQRQLREAALDAARGLPTWDDSASLLDQAWTCAMLG